jgi:hypothetical protein
MSEHERLFFWRKFNQKIVRRNLNCELSAWKHYFCKEYQALRYIGVHLINPQSWR